jgi:hypothetical protein
MEEMFKQVVLMWLFTILNVTNVHNYGHISRNCKRVIEPSMKENIDNRNKKV